MSGFSLEVYYYETLDRPPHEEWGWTIRLDGKVIDNESGFENEAAAESHGKCVVRNYENDGTPEREP